MSELLPPGYGVAFKPAEQVNDAEFSRFERYFPRNEGEDATAYATRLDRLGAVVKVTSDEARDVITFRGFLAAAAEKRVPLALLTAPIPTLPDESAADRQAAKAAALAAARQANCRQP